jgi:hypothetical protein
LSYFNKWISYLASFLVLFYAIEETVFYISGKNYFLPQKFLTESFAFQAGIFPASFEDVNKSKFVYERLCERSKLSPNISWAGNYTIFIDKYLKHEWNEPKFKIKDEFLNGKSVLSIFCRDKLWPDYYLFGISKEDSSLKFFYIDNKANVLGDLNLKIVVRKNDKSVFLDTTIHFRDFGLLFHLKKSPDLKGVDYKFFVHQSFPTGQKVRAYYQMIGREHYDPFFCSLGNL